MFHTNSAELNDKTLSVGPGSGIICQYSANYDE